MDFFTVRERRTGTETHTRQMGPRGEFFAFDYEVSCDPTIEGVGVLLSTDVLRSASWDYSSDIRTGACVGWDDVRHKVDTRLCCTKLLIMRTRDNPVDTSPRAIQELVGRFVCARLTAWAEPIPPLRPEWLTSDVVALARGIHANAALDGLPALTDALIEAGCNDPLVMEHLRTCPDHTPSCWVVEMILDQVTFLLR